MNNDKNILLPGSAGEPSDAFLWYLLTLSYIKNNDNVWEKGVDPAPLELDVVQTVDDLWMG